MFYPCLLFYNIEKNYTLISGGLYPNINLITNTLQIENNERKF